MGYTKVKRLVPGDRIVGSAGTVTEVFDTGYSTMKQGFFTVTTEFGNLLFDPENILEVE